MVVDGRRARRRDADRRHRPKRHAKYAEWLRLGRCSRCGGERDIPGRKTCRQCRADAHAAFSARYARLKAAGLCVHCGRRSPRPNAVDCLPCHEANKGSQPPASKYTKILRAQALAAYGGSCTCCGESEPAFLDIDHISNDGSAHRREIGKGRASRGSSDFARWLRRHGYPPGFQVLCRNCNWGKYVNGGRCPHASILRDLASRPPVLA